MSNIEKIKAEIERRIENYWSDGDVDSVVVSGELEELIDSIDSLPDEKPFDDLEETAEKYADNHGFRVPYDGSNNYYDDVDVKASKDGFIAGAEWQKKQMMKEAVEAYVYESSNPVSEPEKPLHQISLVYEERENIPYITAGHTVQLIIMEDDE